MLPPDLPGSVRADLERNLAAAVIFQNRLADQSPFVLRLYDKFCTDGQNIFIDHEPAKPLDIRALFDPDLEKCTASEWLAVASGLLEALAQIESSGEPSRPHGGIAPGVVLSTDAGLWKVTDFRFAPTICETLGIASYLNLAVGPPAGAEPGVVVTGAWEILPESEDGRDDRICAFIDPQKFAGVSEHGERVFAAFEGGSDMVAAGMIIALFAEHLHPFLGGMRDAHRVVDMASFMGSALATPIRRKDFIESSDEAVVALRDQLKNMLQRLPKDRPRASAAAAALRPFYKDKLDFTSIRHRQDEAEADRWLKGLEELLEASAWSELEKSLGSPPSVQVWPERVSRRLEQIKKKAGEFSNAERVASQRAADGEAASAWFGEFSAAISAESWNEAREIHRRKPTLQFWPGDTLKLLAPLESQLQAEIKRLDDHNIARKWISEIGQSIELGDWTSAEKRLAARPSIDNWPSEVLEQAAARTEQVRSQLDLIKVQHQQAKRWVAEARQAIKNSAHGRAIEILNQRPAIQYWPDKLLDEAAQLIEQCGDRIGDEVVAQLQHHLTFVERAARAFLKEVVDGTFQDTLDAATLSLMIDSDQILSEDSMNRGRAVMVVSLPAKPDVKESPALRVPFEYDLDQKSRPISDPDRRVQSQIVESMGSQLAGLQAKSIPDFAARLKKGLFPNASLRMDHKGYGSKAKAVFAYSKDPKDTLNLTLAWDLRRMEWTLSDADALATRLAERISSSARARVLESVIGEAPLLAEYQAQLQVELDLP
ncbi:MAG TPA: hypothetical protein VNT79_10260, partial [Phycisphaerae bacterium]|nr:hypothetical protein [Phycisphaerae bacterium]